LPYFDALKTPRQEGCFRDPGKDFACAKPDQNRNVAAKNDSHAGGRWLRGDDTCQEAVHKERPTESTVSQ
jgi:hypothetical protein